jgi:hypothetical protein
MCFAGNVLGTQALALTLQASDMQKQDVNYKHINS